MAQGLQPGAWKISLGCSTVAASSLRESAHEHHVGRYFNQESTSCAVIGGGWRSWIPAPAIYNSSTRRWNKPPCVVSWQSQATNNLPKIEDSWVQYPGAIPAICCEEWVVIDADRHIGGADGVVAWTVLQNARGSGPHIRRCTHQQRGTPLFSPARSSDRNRNSQLPPGIDVRGTGGFVIAHGAVLPNGAEWRMAPGCSTDLPQLPPWLEQLIRAEKEVPATRSAIAVRAPIGLREERYAEAVLEGVFRKLKMPQKESATLS